RVPPPAKINGGGRGRLPGRPFLPSSPAHRRRNAPIVGRLRGSLGDGAEERSTGRPAALGTVRPPPGRPGPPQAPLRRRRVPGATRAAVHLRARGTLSSPIRMYR